MYYYQSPFYDPRQQYPQQFYPTQYGISQSHNKCCIYLNTKTGRIKRVCTDRMFGCWAHEDYIPLNLPGGDGVDSKFCKNC